MELRDKTVVVTGGGHGIGEALCRRFAEEGAKGILVADIDEEAARAVAADIAGVAFPADVAVEADNEAMIAAAEKAFGPIDVVCLNAGIATPGSVDAPNDDWQRAWDVNVMAHVYGVRAVLPGMLERGGGYLLHTASAAGLLTNIGAAPYSVTKHAVVALAEWLAVTYGQAGIGVSCLCPQFVNTSLLEALAAVSSDFRVFVEDVAIETSVVAEAVVEGIREERFLILPHPEVADYFLRKAGDYDGWLAGMQRLQHRLGADPA